MVRAVLLNFIYQYDIYTFPRSAHVPGTEVKQVLPVPLSALYRELVLHAANQCSSESESI